MIKLLILIVFILIILLLTNFKHLNNSNNNNNKYDEMRQRYYDYIQSIHSTPSLLSTSSSQSSLTTSSSSFREMVILGHQFAETYPLIKKKTEVLNDTSPFPLCGCGFDKVDNNNIIPFSSLSSSSSSSTVTTTARTTKCKSLYTTVYDKFSGDIILRVEGESRSYPHADQIPQTCGFGKLTFDDSRIGSKSVSGIGSDTWSSTTTAWECSCHAPMFFGGDHCDEPQSRLTRDNKCSKVAHADDLNNFDVSTFNPFVEGVCVECSVPGAVPILDALEPRCEVLNSFKEVDDYGEEKEDQRLVTMTTTRETNPCFYDALNPHSHNSPFNRYQENYGCVCDFYNGFVEVTVEGLSTHDDSIISDACIKIGRIRNTPTATTATTTNTTTANTTTRGIGNSNAARGTEHYHRADLAYYTLQNLRRPIQVHSYTDLEEPFENMFRGGGGGGGGERSRGKKEIKNKVVEEERVVELLVNQPAADVVHKFDWLNRNIKASKKEKIRRIDYPHSDWPVVKKVSLVNYYRRRKETNPVSAYTMAIGRGFETKHWYEQTDNRFLSNAVWGHPVMYTYLGREKWFGMVTLNPVGVEKGWYYGVTVNTKPGEIVRLDTRGYKQEAKQDGEERYRVVTLPPNYQEEMMEMDSVIYIPVLYTSYSFDT